MNVPSGKDYSQGPRILPQCMLCPLGQSASIIGGRDDVPRGRFRSNHRVSVSEVELLREVVEDHVRGKSWRSLGEATHQVDVRHQRVDVGRHGMARLRSLRAVAQITEHLRKP